ncbi:hypothetical protein SCLCIDRAFT_1223065 [Scleroderma citrinum Foug A]|uniref:Uncharacterized protein n=1 Tax=Scleroderma citrinum Foug A TaxID=1036808 RepID=A0A0C3D9X1_9AGAM|nr:hypothetical protein SCLCIDRAFT_1223065 [Scleroderma citrinum Foug A]
MYERSLSRQIRMHTSVVSMPDIYLWNSTFVYRGRPITSFTNHFFHPSAHADVPTILCTLAIRIA